MGQNLLRRYLWDITEMAFLILVIFEYRWPLTQVSLYLARLQEFACTGS